MTEELKVDVKSGKHAPTLYLIVVGKLAEGLLMLLAAVSVYLLAQKNLPDLFDAFIRWIHLDPEGRFFNAISDRLDTVTPRNVHVVASWLFLYGLFKTVGGLGLAFRAPWAVWLAIGESAFFIPIEIFELIRPHSPAGEVRLHAMFSHPRTGIAIVLAVNVLIVWYLFQNRQRLFRHHQ
ncbi:MAG: DUF2127 domain-containing protein [Verrucomicrobiota bacterium]|jgi:uncharacterized membrane protein (DUF2068 family)